MAPFFILLGGTQNLGKRLASRLDFCYKTLHRLVLLLFEVLYPPELNVTVRRISVMALQFGPNLFQISSLATEYLHVLQWCATEAGDHIRELVFPRETL